LEEVSMKRQSRSMLWSLSFLPLLLAMPVRASAPEPQPLIPLEDLARGAVFYAPSLSPDGTLIAYVGVTEGRGAVWVMRADGTKPRLLYRNPAASIDNVSWSGDGRWLVFVKDNGGNEAAHLYRLDPRAPGPPVDLTPIGSAAADLVKLPRRAGGTAIVTLGTRDPQSPDLYSVDLESGRLSLLRRNDGATDFYVDDLGRVRAETSIDLGGVLRVRAGEGAAWKTVYAAGPRERATILGVSPGGGEVIVRSNRSGPTDQILAVPVRGGTSRLLVSRPCGSFDPGEVYWDRQSGGLMAASCVTDKAEVIPLNALGRAAISRVRRLVGGSAALSLVSQSDRDALIFRVEASDRPARYIVYRRGTVTDLPDPTPWLGRYRFHRSQFAVVPARDGLPLPVYITRGAGVGPRPTVVELHGGPWDRDRGAFDPTTQQLVDRGYTVLQVNFRGSTGFGRRHLEAAVGQFGRAMSDDVVDALSWAVSRKLADPGKVCVMGGSYGGYATLVALSRDAQLFRCGVDFAGPSDLVTLVESFPPSWKPYLPRSWYRFVGNPADAGDRLRMLAVSPVYNAEKIRAPLLIFQGANDPRVRKSQSDAIVESLRKRRIPVVYLLASNEGHSFGEESTNLAVKRAMELFFARYLGGRAQPAVAEPVQQTLKSFLAGGGTSIADLE
jgi:dipeptidyl aminopeptidase/acylaminoacyl peptidase